jgi:hypothetical protein
MQADVRPGSASPPQGPGNFAQPAMERGDTTLLCAMSDIAPKVCASEMQEKFD